MLCSMEDSCEEGSGSNERAPEQRAGRSGAKCTIIVFATMDQLLDGGAGLARQVLQALKLRSELLHIPKGMVVDFDRHPLWVKGEQG